MFIAFTILALILIIGTWCFITRCVIKKYKKKQKQESDHLIQKMKEETLEQQKQTNQPNKEKLLLNPTEENDHANFTC